MRILIIIAVMTLAGCGDPNYQPTEPIEIDCSKPHEAIEGKYKCM